MNQTIKNILHISPLLIFVYTARFWHNWPLSFMIGGGIAAVHIVTCFMFKERLDHFLVGADCFLIVGGIAFSARFAPLMRWYGQLNESALFIAIALVGIITTFYSSRGYIDSTKSYPSKIRLYSFYLLGGTILMCIFSYYFRGNVLLAGVVPFWGLYVMRSVLQDALVRHS